MGYLCMSENPSDEAGRALIRQFVLVREAERMGYDDIWLGEQHFDPLWPQGALSAMLGYMAAVTNKSRIGAMVCQPALHDPIRLAEDVATLDLLSKGRFGLGVGSGAAFPKALAAQGLTAETARARMHANLLEAFALMSAKQDLPGNTGLPLYPKPAQSPVPVWMACDDEAGIRLAAEQGWGLMAAATHTLARVERATSLYKEASGGKAPLLMLARFASTAATRDEALAIARPYFDTFATRALAEGWGRDRSRSIAQDVDALLAESLMGSHTEVAEQFKAIGVRYGATGIAIVPTSAQFDTHKHILADFVDEIRPMLDED
jgi:alkanesulfonate monooxygenase SsuD/methylene tetrahydromethanopterin reductase-like flavin-dependent oxidoreductase (luciferase family)